MLIEFMFYEKTLLKTSPLTFQIINLNNKFNLINYIFLTNIHLFNNNAFLLTNTFSNLTNIIFLKNKNKSFLLKKLNQNRKFIISKNFLFKHKFKYNKFLHISFKLKYFSIVSRNKKIINYFNIKSLFSLIFRKKLNSYSHTLIGSGISPYSWELYAKKKNIRKNLIIDQTRNFFYFHKSKNKKLSQLSLYLKKLYINNFFYFKSLKLNFYDFKYLFKINIKINLKNNYDWFLSKPYMFLNNFENNKKSKIFPNQLVTTLFKNYGKTFTFIKKINFFYRIKNSNDVFFKNKNNPFFKKIKIVSNLLHHPFIPFNTKITLFTNQNKNNNIDRVNKKIKVKTLLKFLWTYHFYPRIKFLKKKNSPSAILQYKLINSFKKKFYKKNVLNYARILNRTSRRFKKIFLISKFFNFKNKLNSNVWKWRKKTSIFIKTTTVNLLYVNKLKSTFLINLVNFFYKNKTPLIANFTSKLRINASFFKKPILLTREKSNFLSNKYGFMFLNYINFNSKNQNSIYNLKKTLFSFSYKNEIQKYILKRYSRLSLYTSYNTTNLNLYPNTNFNFDNNSFKNTNQNNIFNFFENQNDATFIASSNLFYSKKWTFFNSQITYAKTLVNDDSNFNIKRIRFKPGYMNIWREARKNLQTTLSLNLRYQHRLTKYLSKFNKFIKFKTFLITEMTLVNILIRSRLVNDHSLSLTFIKNNLIYINGFCCSNSTFQIYTGDFIQFIIHTKYYIISKWLANLIIKKKNKLKHLSRNKLTPVQDSEEKKRSTRFPKWILFNKNSFDDVAKYMEVDFFTLSILILYEPFLWSDINIYNIIDQKFSIINLYNWKYIT